MSRVAERVERILSHKFPRKARINCRQTGETAHSGGVWSVIHDSGPVAWVVAIHLGKGKGERALMESPGQVVVECQRATGVTTTRFEPRLHPLSRKRLSPPAWIVGLGKRISLAVEEMLYDENLERDPEYARIVLAKPRVQEDNTLLDMFGA